MRKVLAGGLLFTAAVVSLAARQSMSGRLSDTTCGASHQTRAAGTLTDRQCLFACIKALSKYALVDQNDRVIPIANQDAMGLPLYAGRRVKLSGESKDGTLFVTKVEAIPAHLHLGHVMTNWRDTPGQRGFLPVALDEARVALQHARLAAKVTSLEEIRLHIGHVLHALDPTIEPKGPGAGYGVKRALEGAQQHLELAAAAEGSTATITTHAAEISMALANARQQLDQAIAAARAASAAADGTAATGAAADLAAIALRLSDETLAQARASMELLMTAEGLAGVPR
jgi:hypothetical protein